MTGEGTRIKVGQLWRRRRDGVKAFIPAHRVADGWRDKAGRKRTEAELRAKYVLVPVDDGLERRRDKRQVNTP
jgi:hypothetical protein